MSKVKIEKKIVGYSVKQAEDQNAEAPRPEFRRETTDGGAEVIRMHEKLERPEMLIGSTYKVKTPVSPNTRSAGLSRFSSTRRTWTTISGLLP
jgi:hypothetical protein